MSDTISIIVPCRNEVRYIASFLASLAKQEAPDGFRLEVLIADGGSDDGSREILEEFAARSWNIRILDNPRRMVSTALNLAIQEASGSVIVRMDVHAEYAPDYVKRCIEVMEQTGAQNVGGPAQTRSQGYLQTAISAAYHSRFACGGARFHDVSYEGPVDTVTFGCWKKQTLLDLGLFDEELVRNQDDELNLRLIRQGGSIWQSPGIRCWYHPRSSLSALFSQYSQYGFWKVHVIKKHGKPASLRHLVPAAFVGVTSGLMALAPLSWVARIGLIACVGSYALANSVASIAICVPRKPKLLPVVPLVLATYHVSYGAGFIFALVTSGLGTRRARVAFPPWFTRWNGQSRPVVSKAKSAKA